MTETVPVPAKTSDYAKYIPERDYISNGYKPIGQEPAFDLCGSCRAYYKDLHERGLTDDPFPPNCHGHVLEPLQFLDEDDFSSKEEYEAVQVAMDPISWAKAELNWEPRFYQERMLSCSSLLKLYRLGRRSGKTIALVIEILHHVANNSNHTCLVVAPYEAQIQMIFDEIKKQLAGSMTLRGSIRSATKSPNHRMEFKNGSMILGFSSGSGSSTRSDKIRGHDAHLIAIDEIDYLADSDLDAIMAIQASHPDCKLIVSSTPKGWRKKFYSFATNKNLQYKEFWFISAEAPTWTDKFEKQSRISYTEAAYHHEFNAEFAEAEDGVFKMQAIDDSIVDYTMDDIQPQHNGVYAIGVDWNKNAGTHIVVVQWDGTKMVLVRKIVVPQSEYLQTKSVEDLIELNRIWEPQFLFLDAGYGSVQTEMLKKHGIQHPETGLHKKTMAFHMNQSVEILDPVNGEKVKKPVKQFLVQQTVKLLEDGHLRLPESEDTSVTGDKLMGLIQQMRNFRVEAYSVHGLPRYSQGDEHTLTAFMLAVGGLALEGSDMRRVDYLTKVEVAGSFGMKPDTEEDNKANEVLTNMMHDTPRNLEIRSIQARGMESVGRHQQELKNARKSISKSKNPQRALAKYMRRSGGGSVSRKSF